MSLILGSAYWPNLLWFYHLLHAEAALIETQDHFAKQTYRNRCSILSANGVLDLSIPVCRHAAKTKTADIRISYALDWQRNHWRAITSAYGNSPYFDFFEDSIRPLYETQTELLAEFNMQQLNLVFALLRMKKEILLTDRYQETYTGMSDLREAIHPKIRPDLPAALNVPYYQTFGEKFGFVANLSILDLLFNKGLGATDYLLQQKK